jgi:hypothetical protein
MVKDMMESLTFRDSRDLILNPIGIAELLVVQKDQVLIDTSQDF